MKEQATKCKVFGMINSKAIRATVQNGRVLAVMPDGSIAVNGK